MSEAMQIEGCEVAEGGWRLNRETGVWGCAWERKADGLVFVARVSGALPGPMLADAFDLEVKHMRKIIADTPLGGPRVKALPLEEELRRQKALYESRHVDVDESFEAGVARGLELAIEALERAVYANGSPV